MPERSSVLLVGCGHMGRALVAGWCRAGGDQPDIRIVEPDPAQAALVAQAYPVTVGADLAGVDGGRATDVVVLAVKPQAMPAVVPLYAPLATENCVFLSIAAGRTISFFEQLLGPAAAIVRAMPNMPAQLHRGITVACANARVSERQRALAHTLLAAVGAVEWVADEALLDPVTAVSGSGPAYVFLLAECLAEAGVKAGLPPALAERLARETVAGAGALLDRSAEPAARLRAQVTSPGGTTAAALAVLDGPGGLRTLMA
ncbi:MAG: pyrroline-5-carboxylate reductase, partial [Defluviicoccus sp.]|nr:pyrroline-5-carboxylate reductase [Defluviicoccus sp.]